MKNCSIKSVTMIIIFVFLSNFIISCATIIGKGGHENLNIRSTPEQATVIITDEAGIKIFEGKTPTITPLLKKRGFFRGKTYNVTISMAGFNDQKFKVDTTLGGWYILGNLVFGGLIGYLIVDPATGAMWTLNNNEINASLSSMNQGEIINQDSSGIVLLKDVPLALRDKMIRVQN